MPWTVCKWKGKILKFVKCSRRPHENGCEMYKNSKKKKKERAKRGKVLFLQNVAARGIRPEKSQTIQLTWNYKGGALFLDLSRPIELFQPLLELTNVLARDHLLKQGQFFSYFILFLWWQTAIVTACAQPNLRQVQNLGLGCLYRRLGNHNNRYHGLGGHNKQHASVNLLLYSYYYGYDVKLCVWTVH